MPTVILLICVSLQVLCLALWAFSDQHSALLFIVAMILTSISGILTVIKCVRDLRQIKSAKTLKKQ